MAVNEDSTLTELRQQRPAFLVPLVIPNQASYGKDH